MWRLSVFYPKFLVKMRDIINGWYHYLFNPIKEAKNRYKVCKKCHKKKMGVCMDCGCICVVKVNCTFCECEKWLN